MTDTHVLSLTTRLAPARKFLVDDAEYEILGMDHLSKEEEALVMARFSKYGQTANALSIEPDLKKGQQLAAALRKQRTSILSTLTTLPAEIADKLPTQPAVALLGAIQEEMAGTEDSTSALISDQTEDEEGNALTSD